jgi:hypothetical protein
MKKASARAVALADHKLLTESQVLGDEVATGADSRAKCAEEAKKDGSHFVMMLKVRRQLQMAQRDERRRA